MRNLAILGAALCVTGLPVLAQGELSCAAQTALVSDAIDARVAGEDVTAVRMMLTEAILDEAADMLAQWIYSLPDENLSDDTVVAFQTQCEALAGN